ncbi:MAG: MotA/TolQ/ExbB proton channel family protein [Bacteroidetes bacterium]|nr:MAG: MotA/TolQ/ExbB proton channel family protein [Bacteroidota bacterium]
MKRKFNFVKLIGLLAFVFAFNFASFAQDAKPAETAAKTTDAPAEELSFHQAIKTKFIEGGPEYMTPILICLIIGLAVAIERILTLNLASTNSARLVKQVEEALQSGGVDAAISLTSSTKGPVAAIFTQGLMRAGEGVDMVEKSVVAYGSVEMGKLERGLIWISLFIALAPMLGFLGTVVGMIGAFDAIEAAGDISPSLVAGGIKVALITTVGGLIVAIILQLFYNYCISKIDSVVGEMEESSIALVDVVVKYLSKK